MSNNELNSIVFFILNLSFKAEFFAQYSETSNVIEDIQFFPWMTLQSYLTLKVKLI